MLNRCKIHTINVNIIFKFKSSKSHWWLLCMKHNYRHSHLHFSIFKQEKNKRINADRSSHSISSNKLYQKTKQNKAKKSDKSSTIWTCKSRWFYQRSIMKSSFKTKIYYIYFMLMLTASVADVLGSESQHLSFVDEIGIFEKNEWCYNIARYHRYKHHCRYQCVCEEVKSGWNSTPDYVSFFFKEIDSEARFEGFKCRLNRKRRRIPDSRAVRIKRASPVYREETDMGAKLRELHWCKTVKTMEAQCSQLVINASLDWLAVKLM